MYKNPLLVLEVLGQSVWLDYLSRKAIESGEIERLIREDGLGGLTSNPSIFEKAITRSNDYNDAIQELTIQGKSVEEICQALMVEDIQLAADFFRPVYERLNGADGFVSLEVSPRLAHDTPGTITEARQLWAAVNRPNLFIKVPATREGLPAIQQLIGEGININITLLFGLSRYREVVEAYLGGLETLAARGKPLNRVSSVASFFLSRMDALIDPLLVEKSATKNVAGLPGQVAISSAKAAYQIYQETFIGERFRKLALMGARPQRLLWASTGTKNPEYSDVKYIEPLIGFDTITTMPPETLKAYRENGKPGSTLEKDALEAYRILAGVLEAGLDLNALTQQLEDEGVAKFSRAYEQSLAALLEKQTALSQEPARP